MNFDIRPPTRIARTAIVWVVIIDFALLLFPPLHWSLASLNPAYALISLVLSSAIVTASLPLISHINRRAEGEA
ncbi:hypothetical protein [Brevibacterium pigmentatum]|uniref:hypothetical protein n=1 Tax=Brevibacterium pigmentatum TaxID=1496080 RepID=UPI00141E95D1|nr:hypothetical protein [Brevibacterium pigmentatum]